MKNNFTTEEFNCLHDKIAKCGTVRVNKAGNLEVKFTFTKNDEWFVLYFTKNNKYLWRRHAYTYYGKCEYPLNMKRGKGQRIKPKWYNKSYWYRPYCVENSEFNTFNEALDYFINNYLVKFSLSPKGGIRYW